MKERHTAVAIVLAWGGIALAGCAKTEERAAEETTVATISLADVAGTWQMRATELDGSNLMEYQLTATADGSDWTIVGPGRPPIRVRILSVTGDSIVGESEPYESFLRPGVQVRLREVYRLHEGKLVSTMEGRFATARGDSLSHRRSEGTRAQ